MIVIAGFLIAAAIMSLGGPIDRLNDSLREIASAIRAGIKNDK